MVMQVYIPSKLMAKIKKYFVPSTQKNSDHEKLLLFPQHWILRPQHNYLDKMIS